MTNTQIAVFGGGCFWCTEAVFKNLKGVSSVTPGYAGGTKIYPTYEDVVSGKTGHAEVIRIEYDPSLVFYKTLLTVFFATHDPTTPNRQGPDVGAQYRSLILYANEEQERAAHEFIAKLNDSTNDGAPIVTEVMALEAFYPAEAYHRNYYDRNSQNPYCQIVINPKLKKVQEKFADLLKQP